VRIFAFVSGVVAVFSALLPVPTTAQSVATPSSPPALAVQQGQLQTAQPQIVQPGANLPLTLNDAIQRGIRSNLSVLERETGDKLARLDRVRALSALLPSVTAMAAQNVQENNIAVFGFRFPGIPTIIGPFGYADLRASAEMDLYNRASRMRLRAAEKNIHASE
jgi:hypothetical protein